MSPAPPTPAPRWIAQSWRRSSRFGVDRAAAATPPAAEVELDRRLRRAIHASASGLRATLAALPVALVIADARGRVAQTIARFPGVEDMLERVQLAEGFDYGEAAVGTNGIGTAAALGRPVFVVGDAHYQSRFTGYACAGAPIRDPSGRVLGVIDLTTDAASASPLLPALAAQLAGQVEARLDEAPRRAPHARRRTPAVPPLVGMPPFGHESRSPTWRLACNEILHALRSKETLLVTGEPGTGRTALVLETFERLRGSAAAPIVVAPADVDERLADPASGGATAPTLVVFRDVDAYRPPQIEALRAFLARVDARGRGYTFALTAGSQAIADDAVFASLLPFLVHTVAVPALRQRSADLRTITEQIAEQLEPGGFARLTERTLRAIERAPWPGNVPQLADTLRVLLASAQDGRVDVSAMPGQPVLGRRLTALEEGERIMLLQALNTTNGNRARAAGLLGCSRSTLYRKLAQYGIADA